MNDFLRSAEEQLKLNKDRISVMRELQDHVETKKEFFRSIGYDQKASAEKANEAMGDGEIVGQRLNKIHRSNKLLSWILFMLLVAVNSLIRDNTFAEDNDFFLHTFLWALLTLVVDLCITAVAIKRKDKETSLYSIFFSFFPLLARNFILVQPLCNLIFLSINNDAFNSMYYHYNFFSIVITILLSMPIVVPNVFNIYHCKQIKELTNTKKHNEISRFMRNACIFAAIISIVLSVPFYAINNIICLKQAELRSTLFDFALDTAGKFDYDEWDELTEYLKSCEYSFEYNEYNVLQDEPNQLHYRIEKYTYRKGDWFVSFTFDEKETANGYRVEVNHQIDNLSLEYLYLTDESRRELRKKLGEPYEGTDNVAELSAYEIRSIMKGYSFTGISVEKQMDNTVYNYEWLMPFYANRKDFSRYNIQFNCESNGICYQYKWY